MDCHDDVCGENGRNTFCYGWKVKQAGHSVKRGKKGEGKGSVKLQMETLDHNLG